MGNGNLWEKVEQWSNKAAVWMEKEYEKKERETQRKLRSKTDDELIRISRNPELSDFHRGFVEDEMRRRGL
ncbi:MAG: hypothetical protein HFH49_13090 [Lachnospiraceae bacterium]|nr:hypothetical protein [Lachnospiraceae bacterium]